MAAAVTLVGWRPLLFQLKSVAAKVLSQPSRGPPLQPLGHSQGLEKLMQNLQSKVHMDVAAPHRGLWVVLRTGAAQGWVAALRGPQCGKARSPGRRSVEQGAGSRWGR